MRNINKELEVDIIGGQKPLTKEKEKAISEFIKMRKKNKNSLVKRRGRKQKKVTG